MVTGSQKRKERRFMNNTKIRIEHQGNICEHNVEMFTCDEIMESIFTVLQGVGFGRDTILQSARDLVEDETKGLCVCPSKCSERADSEIEQNRCWDCGGKIVPDSET